MEALGGLCLTGLYALRASQQLLEGRQFVQRQKLRDGLSQDLRLSEAIEILRGPIPQNNGAIRPEAHQRFVRPGEEMLQQRFRR
jgi:hypothetical protein